MICLLTTDTNLVRPLLWRQELDLLNYSKCVKIYTEVRSPGLSLNLACGAARCKLFSGPSYRQEVDDIDS